MPTSPAKRTLAEVTATVSVAFVLAVASWRAPGAAALLVPLIACLLALAALLRLLDDPAAGPGRRRWLVNVTLAVFAGHLVLGLVIASSSTLVTAFGGDAIGYHFGAIDLVRHWELGTPLLGDTLPAGKEGFVYGLAGLYWILGAYQVAGLVVVAALGAALVPIMYDTTRRLFGPDAARVSVVLLAVLPGFLIWTSQLLREAPILFLLAVAANATVRLSERTTPSSWLALGSSLAVLFTLRADVALVAAGGLIVGLAIARRRMLPGATTGLATVGLVGLLVVAGGIGYTGFAATTRTSLDDVSATRQALAQTAASGFAPDQDISTTGRAVNFLPLATLTFALGPFPWQATNLRQFLGVLDALALWFLVPSLIRGVRAAPRRRRLALLLPAVLLTAMLSLLIGNYGTIVRERTQIVVLLIPFIAAGWLRRPRRRAQRPSGAAERGAPDAHGGVRTTQLHSGAYPL